MSDLDTLRSALREPLPQEFGALDVEQIMATGQRIRRRRRLVTSSGVVGVAAVVVFILAGAEIRYSHVPAAGGGLASSSQLPVTSPTTPVTQAPLGTVVSTGIRNAAGELVFYTVKVDVRDLPQTHFGVMAGYRDAAGNLSADYETNEFKGSDSAPGFHSTSVGLVVSGRAVPAFGYYAGPAAKITATLRGKTVRAHQAMLSTGIIVFWFDTDTSDGTEPSKLAAYDVAGHRLPAGNTTVGRG